MGGIAAASRDRWVASLLALLVVRVYVSGVASDLGATRPARIEPFRIEPRAARWFEVASVPGIGDTLAREIAAVLRRFWRDPALEARLLAIPGVGPATLARLRPHLRLTLAEGEGGTHDPSDASPRRTGPAARDRGSPGGPR